MEEQFHHHHHHHQGKQQKYIRGEWLNLRLGRKIFHCKFCNREFYSSQALGGHQNAHKREKTMLEHCTARATAATTSLGGAAPVSKGGAAWHPFGLYSQEPQNFAGSPRREEGYSSINADVLDLDLKL